MQSKEQLKAELSELEAKAANIREQLESLDKKLIPEDRMKQLMLEANSWKVDEIKFPHTLFAFKDSKVLWEYDSENKTLRLNYLLIWRIFELEYSLDREEIEDLVKNLVEKHFKIKLKQVCQHSIYTSNQIEMYFFTLQINIVRLTNT